MSRTQLLLLPTLVFAVSISFGCTESVSNTDAGAEDTRLKLLGIMYGKFLSANGGNPPKDEQQLLRYLESTPRSWEKLVSNPVELLNSPYDGEPLNILYGVEFKKQAEARNPIIGYERTGVNGLQKVITVRGSLKDMKSDQIPDNLKG